MSAGFLTVCSNCFLTVFKDLLRFSNSFRKVVLRFSKGFLSFFLGGGGVF